MIVAPVVGFALVKITRHLKSLAQRMLARSASFHEVMLESLGNIQTVQAYGMEDRESQRFHRATEDMRNFGVRFIFYSALTKPVIEFLGLGMLCVTIVGGAYLVLNQRTDLLGIPICSQPLTVSQLLIFFGCLIGASDPSGGFPPFIPPSMVGVSRPTPSFLFSISRTRFATQSTL